MIQIRMGHLQRSLKLGHFRRKGGATSLGPGPHGVHAGDQRRFLAAQSELETTNRDILGTQLRSHVL